MSARRTARRGISRGKEAYAGSLFSRVSTKSIKKARGITMGRSKKDGRRVNFYMKTEVLDLLERYSDEVGQTKTEATERILKSYLEEYFRKAHGIGHPNPSGLKTMWKI